MIPVDQTVFGDGKGNCFAACVASLLHKQVADVPNFCVEHSDADWYLHFAKWLQSNGFGPLTFAMPDEAAVAHHLNWARTFAPGVPWIAGGDTPRGKHAVIYVGGELAHDPNPLHGRTGLLRVEDVTFILGAINVRSAGEN